MRCGTMEVNKNKGGDLMKKATVFLLLVCLAALLVGCGGQKETVDGGAQSKTQAATDVKEEAAPGTASEIAADSDTAEDTLAQQGGAAKADTGSSAGDAKPAAGKTPARENGASAPSKAGSAGGESSDSAGSSSSKPAGSGAAGSAEEKPAPQPEEKVFDMDYWLGYAKDYAVGIGLRLDENAADSWDTPIRCSSKTEDVLAAYIRDDLTYYKNEEGCMAVWIWAEQVGDGQYELFIGRG